MTSVNLDPLVGQKLSQFKRRRVQLLVARGVSAGLLSFLIAFSIVALVDWYWLLSDSVRWTLTLSSYSFVALTIWFACISRIAKKPSDEETAVLMETTEPELRENLLSAVELATDDPDSLHDSPVFRGLLQGAVATKMGRIQVSEILPLRLVAKWMTAACVVVAVVVALLLAGDSRILKLAARALMPGANIERISRIQVKVLSPSPSSLVMAEDETVAIVVEVTGGKVSEVTLETYTPTQGVLRQPMTEQSTIEFISNVHLANEPVEYRIFAGDAITQRFTIDTRSRPHVTAFQKTYQYPEYALLNPKTITENHGDLVILEGTDTSLLMEIDQPVSKAELRISPLGSDEIQVIPLNAIDGKLQTEITVTEPAYYKIHLVSEETGFENIFSPKYEIRPQPDLVPKAGFVNQTETTMLLPPNDLVTLKGMGEDDLPLVSLEQHVSINGEDWIILPTGAQPVESTGGKQMEATWKWDFLEHQLKPGDEMVTKLVALDRKGNTGESIPLRIIIAERDFDPNRHLTLLRKLKLYDELLSFAATTEEQKASLLEIIALLKDDTRSFPDRRSDLVDLVDTVSKQQEQAGNIFSKVTEVLKAMPAGADAYDLDLTARVVARIQHEYTNTAMFQAKTLNLEDESRPRQQKIKDLEYTLNRIGDDVKSLAYHYQSFATHNFLAGIASDFHAMNSQQEQIVKTASDSWDRLKRQQAVVTEQMEDISQLIELHGQSLPGAVQEQLKNLNTWIKSELKAFLEAGESEEKFPQLKNAAINLQRQLATKQRFDILDGGLPQRITGARRDFENRSGSLHQPLHEAANSTREENRLRTLDPGQAQNIDSKIQFREMEVNDRHEPSFEQFRARRDITQARRDTDTQYAADAGLTFRAASALIAKHKKQEPESKTHEHLLEIAPAYRTLEAGHALKQTEFALNLLLNRERWNSQRHSAITDHPRQWEAIVYGLEFSAAQLSSAGIDSATEDHDRRIVTKIGQLRSSTEFNRINQKIGQRRSQRNQVVSAATELSTLRNNVANLNRELKPAMDEARAIIQKYAPTITELAEEAARDIRELEQQTTDAAENSESDPQDNQQEIKNLEKKQEQINQKLDDLFDALVEDANKQDLLDDQQRERARDADDSIQMVKEPAKEMNKALDEATETPQGRQQAEELSNAVEQQEKTAQALEKIAEHYDKLDKGEDVTQSREELRQSEQQTGIENQLEQNFKDAEELAQMTQQNPRDLMKELEAELQKNPAMQKSLSEITKNTLKDAQNALTEAAKQENQIQATNEQSDAKLQEQKTELATNLREAGAEAAKLSRELVQQANQAATQGKTPEAQNQITEAQKELNAAAAEAATAQPNQLLKELQEKADKAQKAIDNAAKALANAKQETEKGKNQKIHPDENSQKAQKAASEKQLEQFRKVQSQQAKQQTRVAENQKRQTDNRVRTAENQLKNTNNRLNRAKQALNQKPDDPGRKNQVRNEENRKKAEEQKLADAKTNQAKANQQLQQAKQNEAATNSKPKPSLNSQNPAAELADQLTREANDVASKLKEKIDQITKDSKEEKKLTPTKNQLANAEKRQEEITQDVQQIAEDLKRAARHEQRLNNQQAANELDTVAENVQKTADQEATNAQKQLAKAAGQAEPDNPNEQKPATNAEASKAQQAVADAEQALKNQAEALSNKIEEIESQPASQPQPNQGEPQSNQGEPQSNQGEPQSNQGEPQSN
ncbi:MAG: hypothetical protein VX438_15740, partial [Planctomycetota bacterium]|nr:hypothetical protein [Planctomycetota bacterium]